MSSVMRAESMPLALRKPLRPTPAAAMIDCHRNLLTSSQATGKGSRIIKFYPIAAIAGMAGPSLLQGAAAFWGVAKAVGIVGEIKSVNGMAAVVEATPNKEAAVRELMNQRILKRADLELGTKERQGQAWDALIAAGYIKELDQDCAAVKFTGTLESFNLPVNLSAKPRENDSLMRNVFTTLQKTTALNSLQQDRLATKLAGKGIQVLDIPSAVRIYKDVYAKPHFWSVGAGRRFFNKTWVATIWAISALPVLLNMASVASRVRGGLVLTLALYGLGKAVGFVREQLFLRRLRKLVEQTPDGREQLRAEIAQLPPRLQKRLSVNIRKER